MICVCGKRMVCRKSVATKENSRYRLYKCIGCGTRKGSLELPEELITSDAGKELLKAAKVAHIRLAVALRKHN